MSVELEQEVKEIEALAEKKNIQKWSFWKVFSSTFLTILFAEMGDKTQLATLLLSAQSSSPWIVFIGAALALIATSLVGVLLGYWLSKRLTPKILDLSLSLLLLLVAGSLIMDVLSY
ncbi:TMEM165/GDT1 family protein [Cyanobacterium sp. IPPAS B-1200]|uniref:TMEM165/GDT1 family protein n=1 Tax=Cyanobacterium sp. IPPAS B-1200 TaxID=1562720 RepID=UPI000852850A|nr:TMEM165/GDT1 family protein [Cyanobacterium sp. IPPAS B-1200]OEJ78012.1 hypothetical protein A5482_04140 [Cyanobacterium sp. IPPAS B-1200]